jgi:hypothetical protein
MNVTEIILIATFLLTIAGLIYKAGRTSEQLDESKRQTKQWADGLAGLVRKNSTRAERRWMLQLADDIEVADTDEKRKRIATRIREEVWRE